MSSECLLIWPLGNRGASNLLNHSRFCCLFLNRSLQWFAAWQVSHLVTHHPSPPTPPDDKFSSYMTSLKNVDIVPMKGANETDMWFAEIYNAYIFFGQLG